MPLTIIASERFAEHLTPPGHPERPERAEAMEAVAEAWRRQGGEVVAPRAATTAQLARVHGTEYLRKIAATSGFSEALDPDTYTSPESHEIALLAAGAAIDAVERVLGAEQHRTLALVRPPGHHAECNRAMGFCFYNNVAVAASHARALGVGRVAIVDYDVHHGNGTQHMFESDPEVLYISLHQFPFYPGTGAVKEMGIGRGAGFTVNIPLEVGAVDGDYQLAFASIVSPVLRQFEPALIVVSAGFDAHERDPLAGMRLTSAAFGAMTMELRLVADECCNGRLAVVTEGGYDLRGLAESLQATIQALTDKGSRSPHWPSADSSSTRRGTAAVAAVRESLARYWRI